MKILVTIGLAATLLICGPLLALRIISQDYREAEPVADHLLEIVRGLPKINKEELKNEFLKEKHQSLHSYAWSCPTEGEVIFRLKVNKKYTLGIGEDGRLLWNPESANKSEH